MKANNEKGMVVYSRPLRTPFALASVLTVALLAASCNGQQATGGENTAPAAAKESAKDWTKESVELTYYYMGGDGDYQGFMESYGGIIQKKYPNFTFKYMQSEKGTTLEDIIATKTKIDFFGYTAAKITPLMDAGMADDMSDLIKKYKIDMSKLEPTTVNAMTNITGGKIIGFPLKIISGTLFYNKDLFDKFGVSYLTDTMTWDQVIGAARKLTRSEGGAQYYGLGINPGQVLGTNSTLPPYVDAKTHQAQLTNDYWTKMFNRVLPLVSISDNVEARNLMANYGKMWSMFNKDMTVAIAEANNSAYPQGATVWAMNWDIAQFPDFADMPNVGPQPNPYYFFLSKNSPNRDAAFLAISSLISDEMQLELAKTGRAPALKDRSFLKVLGSSDKNLKDKHTAGLVPKRYGEMATQDDYTAAATSALNTAFADVVAGKKDVNTALRDATEAANKKIETIIQAK